MQRLDVDVSSRQMAAFADKCCSTYHQMSSASGVLLEEGPASAGSGMLLGELFGNNVGANDVARSTVQHFLENIPTRLPLLEVDCA